MTTPLTNYLDSVAARAEAATKASHKVSPVLPRTIGEFETAFNALQADIPRLISMLREATAALEVINKASYEVFAKETAQASLRKLAAIAEKETDL